MMRYNNLKQRPKHFLSFTGLTVPEFDKLVLDNYQDWQSHRAERLIKNLPNRKRKLGGGRKFALKTFEDQLLLTLLFAKSYCSCLLLEYLFNIDSSTVCRTAQVIMSLIEKDGKYIINLGPRPNKKITTLEELRKVIPDLDEILVDCTEQRIPRPQKKTKRNKHHSGKKKSFTIKTQMATTKQGLIVDINQFPDDSTTTRFLKCQTFPRKYPEQLNHF